jgi:hypothetical protein
VGSKTTRPTHAGRILKHLPILIPRAPNVSPPPRPRRPAPASTAPSSKNSSPSLTHRPPHNHPLPTWRPPPQLFRPKAWTEVAVGGATSPRVATPTEARPSVPTL